MVCTQPHLKRSIYKIKIHHAIFAIILVSLSIGCSTDPAIELSLRMLESEDSKMRTVECRFEGLPKDVKIAYKKRVVYSSTVDGVIEAPSFVAGGFGPERHTRSFEFNGFELKKLFDEKHKILFPDGQQEVALFEGKTADGLKLVWFVGYGEPK